MPEDLKIMVKHFRLLSYLGRDVVQNLADVISTKELEAGSYLYREGDPEDKIYVVKSGRIDLQVTDKVSVTVPLFSNLIIVTYYCLCLNLG